MNASGNERIGIWQRYRSLSPTVFALSLVSFLNDTSSEIIYPLLPTFLFLTLGASPFAIGLIEGFAESIASILKLFSGYLSDRFGNRKFPVFLGYSLAAVVRPLLSFVTSWPQVLFVRVTDRVGNVLAAHAFTSGSFPLRDSVLNSPTSLRWSFSIAFMYN